MVQCTDCGKEFNSEESLHHHRTAKHTVARKKLVVQKKYYWYAGIIVVALLLGWWWYSYSVAPGKYDPLASCLTEKGVNFYGAFWCPHCQEQKGLFGKSAKLLPYVECSTPDGKGQTPICIDKKIDGYPTWEFADGSRISAVVSPEVLAEKAGCKVN